MQIDNPTHYNHKREKEKAEKVLEEVKKTEKKPVFLKQGFSYEFKLKIKKQ